MRLFGKNATLERLRTNPSSIRKIYLQDGTSGFLNIKKKAKQHNVPVYSISRSKMAKIGRNKNTQGVFVDVEDFSYVQYEDLLEKALDKKKCILFLDKLKDPQNLGAMLRSIACLGSFSVVIPTHDSVSVTETVLRIASGGENYVQIAKVSNICNAIKKAKQEGFWIAGTAVKEGKTIWEVEFPLPLGIVIGSEQKGVRDVVKKHIDLEITIPMAAETMSFNAAHATTILCYEITKQKKQYKEKRQAK